MSQVAIASLATGAAASIKIRAQHRSKQSPHDMRHHIHTEIESIVPLDALEAEHRAQALAWVASGAELCRLAKPATPPMHLVSYVVVHSGDKLLLVDHKNAQLWLPPGGHVDPGEHPRNAAARELQEELGMTPGRPIGAPLDDHHHRHRGLDRRAPDVSLWYSVRADPEQTLQLDRDEFHSAQWFALAALPLGRSDPHLRRFVDKLRASAAG